MTAIVNASAAQMNKVPSRPAGRATRLLRFLRARGFIRKASKTLYYRVTVRGNQIMATALRLRQIPAWALAP